MEKNQRLGIKVFYYYLSKKISIGLFVLFISFIVSSSKEGIILNLDKLFSLSLATDITKYLVSGLFILSGVLILFDVISSFIKYISCSFTLDENAFNITRGFLTKREVSIPYRQIQNINIEQSIGNKMLGIGKLVILTEGDHSENMKEGNEGVFEVIDYVLAHSIREFILQRTNTPVAKDIAGEKI